MSLKQINSSIVLDSGTELPATFSIALNDITCQVEAHSAQAIVVNSLPKAIASIRRELEQSVGTFAFKNCIHCIHYSSSEMARQMAKGKVGTCTYHSTAVEPLDYCDNFLSYRAFRPNFTPSMRPLDTESVLTQVALSFGVNYRATVYRNGTTVSGTAATRGSKMLCDTKIRAVRRHPRPILLATTNDGGRFVTLAAGKVFTYISAAEILCGLQEQTHPGYSSVITNPQARQILGLNILPEQDHIAAVFAWVRLWLDAQDLTPVVLFSRDRDSPPESISTEDVAPDQN